MKFIRFKADTPQEMKGIMEGGTITRIHGSFFQNYTVADEKYDPELVRLLPPVLPRTIACFGEGAGTYIKSPASLGAGGEIVCPEGNILYCVPRLGFVLTKSGSADIFGIMPVLDFITEREYGGIEASCPGYTATGPLLYADPAAYSYRPEFTVNGMRHSFAPNYGKLAQELPGIMRVELVTGDLLAFGLGECFECHPGDKLSIAFEREHPLAVSLV